MPRFPRTSPRADGLSDRVFGQLVQRSAGRTGRVHPLHVGDTYLEPLPAARAEAQRSADVPRLHNYSQVQGEPALLDAIQDKVERRSGLRPAREDLQVMSGATAGLGVICSALLDPGDEVLLPAPFWPLIRGIIKLQGARPIEVPLWSELDRSGFDAAAAFEAACTERTVAIYLNSPNNPTGRILPEPIVAALCELAIRRDLWVITDEVYEDLWYGSAPPPSIFARPELRGRVIASHSVSKAYGLAGSRVGFSHGPNELMQVVRGVQTFYTYAAPRPLQLGAARALAEGEGWLAEARALYAEAGRAAADALGLPAPEAGTFLFFDTRPYRKSGESAMGFLERCLDAGVMLTPGTASGTAYGEWARLCFTCVPKAQLDEALAALRPLFGSFSR